MKNSCCPRLRSGNGWRGAITLILDSRTANGIRDEVRHKPYDNLRYQLTSSGSIMPTDLLYTNQRRVVEIGSTTPTPAGWTVLFGCSVVYWLGEGTERTQT
jgi:hypothetical protein